MANFVRDNALRLIALAFVLAGLAQLIKKDTTNEPQELEELGGRGRDRGRAPVRRSKRADDSQHYPSVVKVAGKDVPSVVPVNIPPYQKVSEA